MRACLSDSGCVEALLAFLATGVLPVFFGMRGTGWAVQFLRFCGATFLCLLQGAGESKGPQIGVEGSGAGERSQHRHDHYILPFLSVSS